MELKLPTPAIFAHRGASHSAPENTLAAFQLAIELQADGIELDVHLSADGQLVVIHDRDLSRTTNGFGHVDENTLAVLKQLDAGQGQQIPTLAEVFDLVADHVAVNIELKGFGTTTSKIPAAVVKLVQAYGLTGSVILSSFHTRLLFQTRRLLPDARIGLLTLPGAAGSLVKSIIAPLLQPSSLHPQYESVTPRYLRTARQRGRKVLAYTVNQVGEMRRLFGMGIDGIFTDDPLTARQIRGEFA